MANDEIAGSAPTQKRPRQKYLPSAKMIANRVIRTAQRRARKTLGMPTLPAT